MTQKCVRKLMQSGMPSKPKLVPTNKKQSGNPKQGPREGTERFGGICQHPCDRETEAKAEALAKRVETIREATILTMLIEKYPDIVRLQLRNRSPISTESR